MKQTKTKTIEFGKTPEPGMILIGFSCPAEIEGQDLKKEIIALLRKGDVGVRGAISKVKKECLASYDDSVTIVKEMHQDYKKLGEQEVIKKPYRYEINRVFWGYEKDIPKKDARYFKLDVINSETLGDKKYFNPDKTHNYTKIINDNTTKNILVADKKKFKMQEVDETTSSGNDN